MYTPSGTGEARAYLESEADLDDIMVSPDGKWASYQSVETGIEEVYVRSFPVPRQQIPVSQGGGQFPRWSPDSQTIYYWHAESALVDTLIAARIGTEPIFTVLSRDPVIWGDYIVENWDLHPDGDRIVVTQPVRTATTGSSEMFSGRFFVVVNWFEELKARLGSGR